MPGWGFKAFVPKDKWVGSTPSLTGFLPGHDYRMLSTVGPTGKETVGIQLLFSQPMDCDSVTTAITIESNTDDNSIAQLDKGSTKCASNTKQDKSKLSGGLETTWTYSANLINVANGIHAVIVSNAANSGKNSTTGTVDRFLFRIGQADNPMIFPRHSNYSESLLYKKDDSTYKIVHKAAGATKFRYSVDFQSSFTEWLPYSGGETNLVNKNWTGTGSQAWKGEHVFVQCELNSFHLSNFPRSSRGSQDTFAFLPPSPFA